MNTDFLMKLAPILLAAALSFVAARYLHRKKEVREDAAELARAALVTDNRVRELEREMATLKANVQPIAAAFAAVLVKQLTHFHTPIVDALLVKLGPPTTLTEDEERELAAALEARAVDLDGGIDESEREAAIMLPMVMKRVRKEQEEEGKLQVVVVPSSHEPEDGES